MMEGERITGVKIYWDRVGYLLIVLGGAIATMGPLFRSKKPLIKKVTTN